jgi:hypothetical protein
MRAFGWHEKGCGGYAFGVSFVRIFNTLCITISFAKCKYHMEIRRR